MSRWINASTPEQLAKMPWIVRTVNKNGWTQAAFVLSLIAIFVIVVIFI